MAQTRKRDGGEKRQKVDNVQRMTETVKTDHSRLEGSHGTETNYTVVFPHNMSEAFWLAAGAAALVVPTAALVATLPEKDSLTADVAEVEDR